MRLLCLSLTLAIIYIMAIVRSSRVDAAATIPSRESSSSSSSSESWEIPPKPPKPATQAEIVEAMALTIPTMIDGIIIWFAQAFEVDDNNTMHIAEEIKNYPWLAQAVQEYTNKSLTW